MIAHQQFADTNQNAGNPVMLVQSTCPHAERRLARKASKSPTGNIAWNASRRMHRVVCACHACGTVFQQPMRTTSKLSEFYPSDYQSMTHAGLPYALPGL
jgi:hypothetical protein